MPYADPVYGKQRQKERSAKYMARLKAEGKCTRCRAEAVTGMRVCQPCRLKLKTYARIRNQQRSGEQKCLQCSAPRPEHRAYCDRCSAKKAAQASKHRTTLEDRVKLFGLQQGKCGICEKALVGPVDKRTNVDHDHATGKVRGLLCMNCNTGIGNLRDSIELLQRAISYLTKGGGL